jgi:hypothetical protein
VLAKYSRDLTSLAAEGKLDPVSGRHDEMRRLIIMSFVHFAGVLSKQELPHRQVGS